MRQPSSTAIVSVADSQVARFLANGWLRVDDKPQRKPRRGQDAGEQPADA